MPDRDRDCLQHAIGRHRAAHGADDPLAPALACLEAQGRGMRRDPDAEESRARGHAAGFMVCYVEPALGDHRIAGEEMQRIAALKSIFAMREGDLFELRGDRIAGLLRDGMERMLVDERIGDGEALHRADLQRASDLGYDQYPAMTRGPIRRIVERLLAGARDRAPDMRAPVLRRIAALRTDPATMTVVGPAEGHAR